MRFCLKLDPNSCTACRACELACSFHHRGIFNPRIASIAILRSGKKDDINIVIFYKNEDNHLACNNCNDEKEPLCVKYCVWGAITAEELHTEEDRDGEER